MRMTDRIQESIERDAAEGVSSITVDGIATTAMSIGERIQAARYLAAQQAAAQSHFGLRFTKLVPPGGGP